MRKRLEKALMLIRDYCDKSDCHYCELGELCELAYQHEAVIPAIEDCLKRKGLNEGTLLISLFGGDWPICAYSKTWMACPNILKKCNCKEQHLCQYYSEVW